YLFQFLSLCRSLLRCGVHALHWLLRVLHGPCSGIRLLRRNHVLPRAPCRYRYAGIQESGEVPPDVACSPPLEHGWSHRSRGTGCTPSLQILPVSVKHPCSPCVPLPFWCCCRGNGRGSLH